MALAIKIINEHLVEKQKKNQRPKVENFYPSSVGVCSRAIVYSMIGYPKKIPDERALLIFENGHSFHNRMEKIFRDAGVLIADELPIKNAELKISGRSDAIIRDPEYVAKDGESTITLLGFNGEALYEGVRDAVIIVELKSINDNGFSNRLSKPKPEHVRQLQLYMHLTGLKRGILLYENKNNQNLKEFEVPYDADIASEVINKIKNVHTHVENKTLPDKEYERSSFECRYCDYKEICWPNNRVSNSLDNVL